MAVLHRFYCTPQVEDSTTETQHYSMVDVMFLFVLILYIPVNNFSVMSGWVFLGLTSTKQRIKCLAQGHSALPRVMLEPASLRSKVKHSTTEIVGSPYDGCGVIETRKSFN